jgi:hypothetical protein
MVACLVLVVGAKAVANFPMVSMSFLASKEEAKNRARILMYQWVYSVLSQMGADFGDTIPEDGDPESLSVIQRAQMRKVLETNKIFISDNKDGEIGIYVEDELIGKWNQPHYKMCIDHSKVNKKEKYYMDVEISFGSVFDQEEGT